LQTGLIRGGSWSAMRLARGHAHADTEVVVDAGTTLPSPPPPTPAKRAVLPIPKQQCQYGEAGQTSEAHLGSDKAPFSTRIHFEETRTRITSGEKHKERKI
jgi:hypothetical protein